MKIESTVIGRILTADEDIYALRNGERVDMPMFDADEIVKLWGNYPPKIVEKRAKIIAAGGC
ncbi:MAG: hypothetical protein R2856_06275 [Caldilineaceae bacterium]